MPNVIVVDHEKCTGCRQCELVCSVKNAGVSNPSRSRVSIVKWEGEGFYLPMLCQQCQTPVCMAVCPKDAISRDEELGRVVVDYDLCIGCEMCVAACPFGGMGIDIADKKVIKCELCDGDPTCVTACKAEALEWVDASTANLRKKRAAAAKFSELMRKFV
jgi:Fe-S-cluster-containing hydrogenase component 2